MSHSVSPSNSSHSSKCNLNTHHKLNQDTPTKLIYHFGQNQTEGSSSMSHLLGGKGSNLAEMSRLGLPVPPGFTLSTKLCRLFYDNNQEIPLSIKPLIKKSIQKLEEELGKKFNDATNPLLLSVRSGAPISMPGMMDTILNLGLNEKTVEGLSQMSQNPYFAWDSYRRFIQMYSDVVMGMNPSLLEAHLDDYKNQKAEAQLTAKDWQHIVKHFKESILQYTGQVFPEDPWDQLWAAIKAVFKSWHNPRAIIYRKMQNEHSCVGTAVNIQSMVFGNRGNDCATGVVFTRNPSTGENTIFGEFLVNAQGEDIVAGLRTPQLILNNNQQDPKDLKTLMPNAFDKLSQLGKKLEQHYKYVQDIEFTIENNKLWLLQTRNAKCSSSAQLKIMFDLIQENLLTEKEALNTIDPFALNNLLHPSIDENDKKILLTKGLPASPGGATGQIAFHNQTAVELQKQGLPVILVRTETSPEDINGMISSQGILTARGGMTSHAAVVARSMGKPCIVGCESLYINEINKEINIKGRLLKEGDTITINGSTGEVLLGTVQTKAPKLDKYFFKLMELSDKYTKLEVRANADTPVDVQKAKEFGATGVGLCRTEHMFFAPDRINIMRKMILADNKTERQEALNELFLIQKEDFYQLLNIMDQKPVTIRLLDPPLHEFLPQSSKDIKKLSENLEWSTDKIIIKINLLKEMNPMLGHRGCRLAITFPEIYVMQTKALSEACAQLKLQKKNPKAEIMIPLVTFPKELQYLREIMEQEIKNVEKQFQTTLSIPIGTMIELPNSCLQSGAIAQFADFFSLGTNDLTQTTLGISRDDAGKFLSSYVNQKLVAQDPFNSLDTESVGELIKMAIQRGRHHKPHLKIGICGEHGGDPKSIQFFHNAKLDYVSCSPYRVPIARLSAAQCAIRDELKQGSNGN